MTKYPIRRCLGCMKRCLKSELLRLVWNGDSLVLDRKHTYQARAGYVHDDVKCLQNASSSKLWEKALKLHTGSISTLPDELKPKHSTVRTGSMVSKRIRL